MGRRYAYEPGDKVRWPQTEMAAGPNDRSVTVEDTIVTRYESGSYYIKYLYLDLFQRMIEDMATNVDDEFDNVITVFGHEGTGKSSLVYHIATSFDPDFDIEKSLVYTWEQFLTSVTEDPQRVYWFDEAVLVAAGRDWMREANKMLVSSLQTIRFMHLTIIFAIPSIDNIDVYVRSFRTRYAIKTQLMKWSHDAKEVRGYAELLIPKSESERRSLRKDAKGEDYFKSVGFFRFPKIADATLYDKMKAQNSADNLLQMREQIAAKKTNYHRDRDRLTALICHLADDLGWTYQDIAAAADMPYDTVKGICWRERNRKEDD